jgi:hypothetical protein
METPSESNPQVIRPRYRLAPIVTQHLENSRAWIARAAGEACGGSALVLGAGPCLDIPLSELLLQFYRVVLNDFDAGLLNQALDSLPADARRERIELAVCDLTAPDELLAKVEAILANASDPETALEQLTTAISAFKARPAAIPGIYDLVVASCLLSQLHVMTVQNILASFRQRFGRDVEGLAAAPAWKAALYDLARRMEHKFIDQLAVWLKPEGRCYLSETVQLCYVDLAADGSWETEGSYRMTKSLDLTDYLDERFRVINQGRWQRLDSPPTANAQGRLYDVHALLVARDGII